MWTYSTDKPNLWW